MQTLTVCCGFVLYKRTVGGRNKGKGACLYPLHPLPLEPQGPSRPTRASRPVRPQQKGVDRGKVDRGGGWRCSRKLQGLQSTKGYDKGLKSKQIFDLSCSRSTGATRKSSLGTTAPYGMLRLCANGQSSTNCLLNKQPSETAAVLSGCLVTNMITLQTQPASSHTRHSLDAVYRPPDHDD